MNEIKSAITNNGNIDVYEMMAVLRWGERYGSGYTSIGQDNTLQTSVVLGVNDTNHGKYVTRLFTMSHPDFCVYIPAWVALGQANLSPYVTTHSGVGTIAYWGKKLLGSFKSSSTDDEYLHDLFADVESNIIEGVLDARSKWFASGDQADFYSTINEMHQRSAWCAYHALKSAYNTRGSGRQCNDIPVITNMNVTPEGTNSITCSATANDADGIAEYSWKFGDGSASVTGANQTHTYSVPGTYMVSVIAKDNHTHMAANVMFKWVTVTAVCTPDCVGKECGDDGCGGSCGSCADPFLCQSGTCECPEGLEDCSGTCVDLQTNDDHCGDCDNGCNTDAVCILGVCSPMCGDTICDGAENCENCPSDCPTAGDEVCCSGVLHSGDCCDDQDCVAPDTCIGWSCLPPSTCENDADGDHYGVGASCVGPDCDDADPTVHPGAPERCNGVDDDCDETIDDDWPDLGNACSAGVGQCEASGTMLCTIDGRDATCDASPGSPEAERCGDEIDNDCDGLVDEDCGGEAIIGGCRVFPYNVTGQVVVVVLLLVGCARGRKGNMA
ncbi:PKD domain-containing protein [Myxococcota bacterium]